MKVKIIGAGLSGLTTAYYLRKKLPDVEIEIIEKGDFPGGRLLSREFAGGLVELGAFMVMPWYKHYRALLKDLNLLEELQDYKDFKQIYARPQYSGLIASLKFFASIIPTALKGGLNINMPNPEIWQHEKSSNYYQSSGAYASMERINDILSVYTYPNLNQFASSVYFPFAFKMEATKSWDNLARLKRGSSSLIDALYNANVHNNVSIKFGETWDGQVAKDEQVVIAANLDSKLWQSTLGIELDVKYTQFLMAIVELESNITELGPDWHIYYNKNNPAKWLQINGIGNCQALFGTNRPSLLLSMRVADHSIYAEEKKAEFESIIKNMLSDIFPSSKVAQVVEILKWDKAMPMTSNKDIIQARAAAKAKNIILAGDTFGFPCMENAIQSGVEASIRVYNAHKLY